MKKTSSRPEVRIQLLRIHKLALKQLGEGLTLSDEEVDELSLLINEADMTIFGMIGSLSVSIDRGE